VFPIIISVGFPIVISVIPIVTSVFSNVY
jgi:hypothetical protein